MQKNNEIIKTYSVFQIELTKATNRLIMALENDKVIELSTKLLKNGH